MVGNYDMFEELVEMVVLLNLFLSIIIIVNDLYFYFKVKEPTGWSKLLYAAVGFFWFVRYILFYLQFHPFDFNDINPSILILTTFTLLSLAVGSNIRIQRDIGIKNMLNDLRGIKIWISRK